MINALIKDRLADARGIAWDGCHKIYILMDQNQMDLMREYGYDPLIPAEDTTPAQMFIKLRNWYDQSCTLRFINAVSTVTGDPNRGFETLVGQEEDWFEDQLLPHS